ncbi:MAG: translocation/assembly module TamB, partial [Armatimonadetes bacterium]|nr:translocation/assembly module TamB [Armatimonadota bacterium]
VRLDAALPLGNPRAARIALSLPSVAVDAALLAPFLRAQNVALDGNWRGRVSLLSRQGQSGKFGLDFNLAAPASTLRGLGKRGARVNLQSPTLTGRADFDAQNPARGWSATATLRARESRAVGGTLGRFAALPARLSGARAVGLELNIVARDAGIGAPLDWAGQLSARRLSAPLPAKSRGPVFATVSDVRAYLEGARGGVEISRFTANFGAGRLSGTAKIQNGAPQARILARNVDMKTVQLLLAPQTRVQARLTGTADLALQIAPDAPARAQIRLARGSLILPEMAGAAPFPLDGARALVSIDKAGIVRVRDAAIWSEGARFAGDATLGKTRWSGNLRVSGARLARFAALPLARALSDKTRPDGLASGVFTFQVDPNNLQNASVSGRAAVKLASIAGASIDTASAQVSAQSRADGWKITLTDIVGRAENAPFSGEVRADSRTNAWSARLATQNLESGRLARLGALSNARGVQDRTAILERALPVAGEVGADIELSGTLRGPRGNLAPRANDGFVRVASGPLLWRGRSLGLLRADVEVENGVARAKTLELSRPATAGNAATPIVSVAGTLPLDPDATGLDAQIRVAQAPLSFFTEALGDASDALARAGIRAPLFERAVDYVNRLPQGTVGNVALEADLQGGWRAPRLHVTNLTLRNGRTRVPAGGFSPPATLDAAFVYEKGAVRVEKAEFRLQKSAILPSPTGDAVEEDDDTLLRIEPGGSVVPDGPITLAGDVFNANLSQLSTWVPALRNAEGGPLLRGQLTEISFRVGGTTLDPSVTGSVQAENLSFNSYTLDRLRLSRFEIEGGQARVDPGNLTVVRGAFQSSAAYGSVPWKWAPPGPDPTGALNLHFPIQTRDFGALIGVVLPSLSVADADEFQGSIDVTGTMQAPQISGAVTIRGGQFRFDPRQNALEAGLRDLSGTVRFVGGNQLLIDPDDPLRGKLVPADAVVGRVARSDVAVGQTVAANVAPQKPVKKAKGDNGPTLAGEWVLRGGITRPAALDKGSLLDPALALSRLKYDLNFSLDKGAFGTEAISGVQDVSLGAIWRTGAGENPQFHQTVRWMLAARGKKPRKAKSGGELASFGALTLNPDFASGIEAIGRSRAENFSSEADFAGLEVARRIDVSTFPDRRAQVRFDSFAAALTGVASGVVDGRLVLDNRGRIQQPPREAVQLQRAALTDRGPRPSLFGPAFETQWRGAAARSAESSAPVADFIPVQDGGEAIEGTRLRLGGVLTLESAQISGAPAGGAASGGLLLSSLPDVPVLDVKLLLGREVEIVTSAFRAGLGGEIVASGSPSNPQVLGVLETRDGQVRFPNARARVVEGRVSLALNRNPETDTLRTRIEIDTTARGQAGRYAITLRMRGPLDMSGAGTQNLNIEVTSNPPLSQSEAFEQLLGTVPTQELQSDGTFRAGSSNQAYARAVLNVLSAPLFSGFEQTVARALGLTSVSFEYRFDEPLAVEFTKAVGDRVFLSYRRSLGSGGPSSVNNGRTPFELRIEYRIKGNYLLGLQTDEQRIPKLTVQ